MSSIEQELANIAQRFDELTEERDEPEFLALSESLASILDRLGARENAYVQAEKVIRDLQYELDRSRRDGYRPSPSYRTDRDYAAMMLSPAVADPTYSRMISGTFNP